ncbi:Protein phosphatase 1L [Entomortierella chlamydospora]|nr:Protein phosphatase 1L [Entomortierella chlamydospora]
MTPRALEPTLHINGDDSDATESDTNASTKLLKVTSTSGKGQSTNLKSRSKTAVTTARRKPKQPGSDNAASKNRKRKPASGWTSSSLSSDNSEDDTRQHRASNGRLHAANHSHHQQQPQQQQGQQQQEQKEHEEQQQQQQQQEQLQQSETSAKRIRTGSPSSSTSSAKLPGRRNSIPNGLKKLPKGYVYDTEINQSALMRLSVNPSLTGEYMRHLKGKNALENNFPDRRGEYGVDLAQEPSLFALEQQAGYTYPRLRNSRERLPKGDCEDGYAIADLKHNGGYLGRLFSITDGHGGRACSSFVIATIPGAMQVILGKYKPSDLSLPKVQDLVKTQISEAIRLIDKEYLDYKKQQYLLFKSGQLANDPGSDGTTLIVNIFIDKWIICLNLGDSRTMIGSRDSIGRWNVDFFSEDHTPSLERLAQTIYANGGEFVTHDDKVIKFDPNLKNDKKHRQSLREARIRVKDGESNEFGIPFRTKNGHCASVNLGACIGDVLYKLDPVNPVLSCKPDITFIDISKIQQGFLLMASDGLWDYVQRGGKVHDQNATVCHFVGDKIDRGWNHQRIVYSLSDRENATGLYSDSIQEYDDFTAILVTFNPQQLERQKQQHMEFERKQKLLQQQRAQEQQVLLMHQQRLQHVQSEKDKAEQEQLRREQETKPNVIVEKGDDDTDSDVAKSVPESNAKTRKSRVPLSIKADPTPPTVKKENTRDRSPKSPRSPRSPRSPKSPKSGTKDIKHEIEEPKPVKRKKSLTSPKP